MHMLKFFSVQTFVIKSVTLHAQIVEKTFQQRTPLFKRQQRVHQCVCYYILTFLRLGQEEERMKEDDQQFYVGCNNVF